MEERHELGWWKMAALEFTMRFSWERVVMFCLGWRVFTGHAWVREVPGATRLMPATSIERREPSDAKSAFVASYSLPNYASTLALLPQFLPLVSLELFQAAGLLIFYRLLEEEGAKQWLRSLLFEEVALLHR